MSPLRPSLRRIALGVVVAFSVVVPLLLLLDPAAIFERDWSNHLAMIGYYGEYFRQHHTMPGCINVANVAGAPQPVFYAYLLYPMLGVLSAAIGPALAVRLAALVLLAVQFFALRRAGRAHFQHEGMAFAVAVTAIWAVYSLTDLYNRGALPEFFGTGLLNLTIGFAGVAVGEARRRVRWFYAMLAWFSAVLAAGSHPPTALLEAALAAIMAAALLPEFLRQRKTILRSAWFAVGAAMVVGVAILAPWLYAVLRYGRLVHIATLVPDLIYLPDRSDSWWGRFAPLPHDALSTAEGVAEVSTPYLEAPIAVSLLLFVLWNLELIRRSPAQARAVPASGEGATRSVLAAALGWFVVLTAVSVSPALAFALRWVAPAIQYAYRLVAHCSAALLIAVLASGALVAARHGYQRFRRDTAVVLAVGLTLAATSLWLKLEHAAVVATPGDASFGFYGDRTQSRRMRQRGMLDDYSTPGLWREMSTLGLGKLLHRDFPEALATGFGTVTPITVDFARAQWLSTNAVAFPWNRMSVDGVDLPSDRIASNGGALAVSLPSGQHEVRITWTPDRSWATLHWISQFFLCATILAIAGWAACEAWRTDVGRAGIVGSNRSSKSTWTTASSASSARTRRSGSCPSAAARTTRS